MALRSRLTAKVGRVFTKVVNKLEGGGSVLLLKVSDDYPEFETLLEVESKWFFEYSNFRKNFLLEIAEDSTELTEAIAESTHVQVDDDYYVIIDGDTTPPKSTDVTWKIYVDRDERFAHYKTLGA